MHDATEKGASKALSLPSTSLFLDQVVGSLAYFWLITRGFSFPTSVILLGIPRMKKISSWG